MDFERPVSLKGTCPPRATDFFCPDATLDPPFRNGAGHRILWRGPDHQSQWFGSGAGRTVKTRSVWGLGRLHRPRPRSPPVPGLVRSPVALRMRIWGETPLAYLKDLMKPLVSQVGLLDPRQVVFYTHLGSRESEGPRGPKSRRASVWSKEVGFDLFHPLENFYIPGPDFTGVSCVSNRIC